MGYNRERNQMKRVYLLTATIAIASSVMFSFTSCKKDGVYKPKEKISQIFSQQSYYSGVPEIDQLFPTEGKILEETWTWDGKLLSSIDYGGGYVAYFEYEKKRLDKITFRKSRR
jgi:hypothetical protein